MRYYRPVLSVRGGRYRSRLHMSEFGASSIADIVRDFDTAEDAVADLVNRLLSVYQRGDLIEVRGNVYRNVGDIESELRASLGSG